MSVKNKIKNLDNAKSLGVWPISELEAVPACPVCGGAERTILIDGIHDNVFFCAPGSWTIQSCDNCQTGYLDPRPIESSIGRAYNQYYTHPTDLSSSILARIRIALANGYKNFKYGTTHEPSTSLGVGLMKIFPSLAAVADGAMRHLPRTACEKKILDVGCAGGNYLMLLKGSNWKSIGLDPDPIAVESARAKGLNVILGNIDSPELEVYAGQFDGITLSHVLEHVHNPIEMLEKIRCLIKPGGWLWVETPNIDAQGFDLYRESWIGLDPPRHITHFNRRSLQQALEMAGYSNIEDLPYRPLCKSVFAISDSIANGNGYVAPNVLLGNRQSRLAEKEAFRDVSKREFCSLRAIAS